jgi:hypothetical protein
VAARKCEDIWISPVNRRSRARILSGTACTSREKLTLLQLDTTYDPSRERFRMEKSKVPSSTARVKLRLARRRRRASRGGRRSLGPATGEPKNPRKQHPVPLALATNGPPRVRGPVPMEKPTPDHPWTTEECASYLGVSIDFLNTARCKGNGPPFYKLGRLVRYPPEIVKAWEHSRIVGSTSDERK